MIYLSTEARKKMYQKTINYFKTFSLGIMIGNVNKENDTDIYIAKIVNGIKGMFNIADVEEIFLDIAKEIEIERTMSLDLEVLGIVAVWNSDFAIDSKTKTQQYIIDRIKEFNLNICI